MINLSKCVSVSWVIGLSLALLSSFVGAIEPGVTGAELVCPAPTEGERSEGDGPDSPDSGGGKRLPAVRVNSIAFEARIRDGNPLYLPGNENAWNRGKDVYPTLVGPVSVDELDYSQLADLEAERIGVAADGVSQLIIVLEASVAGTFGTTFSSDSRKDGTLYLLGSDTTCKVEEAHFMVALYTAPEEFGPGSGQKVPTQVVGGVEARTLEVGFTFSPKNGAGQLHKTVDLKLVRPPVVLVHGFGDEPINAWMTPISVGMSLNSYLRNKGLLPFLVDYEASNGRGYLGGGKSSFRDNRFVVWTGHSANRLTTFAGNAPESALDTIENAGQQAYVGGIRQALAYYREELEVAVTRADVIGHSMGGLLPRVYAADKLPAGVSQWTTADTSDDANPATAYNKRYRRPDNFQAGDINRLVTLNTPHDGSEQLRVFEQLTKEGGFGPRWASVYKTVADGIAFVARVRASSMAMQGLKTDSRALQLIGETRVNSHVIVGVTRPGGQEDLFYDPGRSYMLVLEAVGALFYWFPDELETYLERVGAEYTDPVLQQKFLEARRNLEGLIDSEWMYWNKVRGEEGFLRSTAGSLLAGGEHSMTATVPYVFLEALRSFMFRFDKNDSTVRLDSQLGGLDLDNRADRNFITYIDIEATAKPEPDIKESVLHSQAPRYMRIQRRIVDLLKSDPLEPTRFRESLPPAGQKMKQREPAITGLNWRLTGDFARKWSGMVFKHADAYLEVARQDKVIIMTRPVNPDSTSLVIRGAATKSMNVKGKSSNWGPQKGYIPADQTYSKLWRTATLGRAEEFSNYTKQTQEMLLGEKTVYKITADLLDAYIPRGDDNKVNDPIAVKKSLQHSIQGNIYTVWAKPGTNPKSGDAEEWVETENAERWVFLCKEEAGGRGETPEPCTCPQWFDWRTNGEEFDKEVIPHREAEFPSPDACGSLSPLEVLADNAHPTENYLTADYDLLTLGFFCPPERLGSAPCLGALTKADGPGNECPVSKQFVNAYPGSLWKPPSPLPCYDKAKGLITRAQMEVLNKINKTVQTIGRYNDGNVSHHGPESQFFKSPYVDYPIIVFDPGVPDKTSGMRDGTAEIIAIPEGPPGFRDVHLKRYFLSKIRQGFWLYPNPYGTANWHWRTWPLRGGEFYGWREEDDSEVPQGKSTAEIKQPLCVAQEVERRRREREIRNREAQASRSAAEIGGKLGVSRATVLQKFDEHGWVIPALARRALEPEVVECNPPDGCVCTE